MAHALRPLTDAKAATAVTAVTAQGQREPLEALLWAGLRERSAWVKGVFPHRQAISGLAGPLPADFHSPQAGPLDQLSLVGLGELTQVESALKARVGDLRPEGLVWIAAVGAGSLVPQRQALQALGRPLAQGFPDLHDLGDRLVAAGLSAPVMESERLTLRYRSLGRAIQDLKALLLPILPAPQGSRTQAREVRWALASSLGAGAEGARATHDTTGFELSLELVFGHAWRPKPRPEPGAQVQTVSFPPSRRSSSRF